MRLGIVGRCEARGLGHQTLAVAEALHPDRVLLVEPRPASWPQNRQWWAGSNVTDVAWKQGKLPEGTIRRWLEGLTVVYTAEAVYDKRFPFWAAEAGCALVRHANPEQLAPEELIAGDPTVWWSATPWRLEHMPTGTRVVPMPVGFAPFASGANGYAGPARFMHSAGHHAQEDRAGTSLLAQAVRRLHRPCRVTVYSQDRRLNIAFKAKAEGVDVRVREGGVDDRWDQYRDQDVLVLPRRYGGLSLPSQEALAAGLALVMTDCPPNGIWPGPKVPVRRRWWVQMRCGQVEIHDADPAALADIMTRLARDRDEVEKWQAESRAWAEANSWEALRPLWLDELERATASRSLPVAPVL